MRFETPDGFIPVTAHSTSGNLAIEIMAFLYGEPWVRLHTDAGPYSQWTVLERDKYGMPLRVGCEEFDGRSSIVSMGD